MVNIPTELMNNFLYGGMFNIYIISWLVYYSGVPGEQLGLIMWMVLDIYVCPWFYTNLCIYSYMYDNIVDYLCTYCSQNATG